MSQRFVIPSAFNSSLLEQEYTYSVLVNEVGAVLIHTPVVLGHRRCQSVRVGRRIINVERPSETRRDVVFQFPKTRAILEVEMICGLYDDSQGRGQCNSEKSSGGDDVHGG